MCKYYLFSPVRFLVYFFLLSSVTFMFGQNIRPPELRKNEHGLMYGKGKVPNAGLKSVSHPSNLPPQNLKIRKSIPKVILPGVRRLVPHEYPTIQGAINACVDGDTVLISEGTYYENIRYKGKAIVVGSYYLIDGDTTHIPQTIINGSNHSHPDSGSVVYFIDGEDTTSVLCGLTITGGTGTRYYYSPDHVWCRQGGGIYCEAAGAKLLKNRINHNRIVAQCAAGGGLEAMGTPSFMPYLILQENRFTENYVQSDTINFAWSFSGGAEFFNVSGRVVSNLFERDSVIGIVGAQGGGMNILGDISGQNPEALYKGNVFRQNYLHATQQGAVGAGLCVGWTSRVSIEENLFEGNAAIAADSFGWADGGGLFIQDYEITNNRRKLVSHNRFMNNRVHCEGVNAFGGGMEVYYSSATIDGNYFTDNKSGMSGAGLFIWESRVTIMNNYLYNNTASLNPISPMESGAGGAIMFYTSFPIIFENNIISGNSAQYGGGITKGSTGILFAINNTIVGNTAVNWGGGILSGPGNDDLLMNNILWGNMGVGSQIYYAENSIPGHYYHNDIQGGWPGTGNIDVDPQFADTLYHLLPSSYCIGLGRSVIILGDSICQVPQFDLDGNLRPDPIDTLVDIGAYETPFPARAHIVKSGINGCRCYLRPCQDSVRILVQVIDPHQQGVNLTASMSNLQGAVWDEFQLYDDGQHCDSLIGDNLFGAKLPPVMLEDAFRFNYYLANNTFQDTLSFPENQQVTSIGPLLCEDCQIISQDSNRIQLRLVLHNLGQYSAANEVRAELIPQDSSVIRIVSNNRSFGNIPAQGTAVNSSAYIIDIIENPGILTFDVRISMGGYPHWLQKNLVVMIESGTPKLPGEFALYQNYPNPFNARTNIEFRNPKKEYVTLKIFNILGEEVVVLVSGQLVAGTHSFEFRASDLASGLYFYRIQAGEFIESKKLLLLR